MDEPDPPGSPPAWEGVIDWRIDRFLTAWQRGRKHYSDVVRVAGCPWRLSLYPRGNARVDGAVGAGAGKGTPGKNEHVGLYLEATDAGSAPSGWRRHVEFKLEVVNQVRRGVAARSRRRGVRRPRHAMPRPVLLPSSSTTDRRPPRRRPSRVVPHLTPSPLPNPPARSHLLLPRPAPPRAQLDPSRSVWRSGVHAFDADTSDGTWGFAQASPTSITALVPVRPRSRGGRRSLRTSWTFPPGARISPPASRARSRRASTPRDAARRDPERTSFRSPRRLTKIPPVDRSSRSSSRAPPSARPTPASSATTARRPSTREDASSCDGSARGAISTAEISTAKMRRRPPARRSRRTRIPPTRGAFYVTLVPIRPRSRGERRSLRTFPGVSLRSSLGFNPRPRRLSTPPTDAFQ